VFNSRRGPVHFSIFIFAFFWIVGSERERWRRFWEGVEVKEGAWREKEEKENVFFLFLFFESCVRPATLPNCPIFHHSELYESKIRLLRRSVWGFDVIRKRSKKKRSSSMMEEVEKKRRRKKNSTSTWTSSFRPSPTLPTPPPSLPPSLSSLSPTGQKAKKRGRAGN
jgi:hypothetical protein